MLEVVEVANHRKATGRHISVDGGGAVKELDARGVLRFVESSSVSA